MKPLIAFLFLAVCLHAQERRRMTAAEAVVTERAAWARRFITSTKDPGRLMQYRQIIAEADEIERKITMEYAEALVVAMKAETGLNVVLDPQKLGAQIGSMESALAMERNRRRQSTVINQEQDAENTRRFYEQQDAERARRKGNAMQNELDRLEHENRKLRGGENR